MENAYYFKIGFIFVCVAKEKERGRTEKLRKEVLPAEKQQNLFSNAILFTSLNAHS